MSLEAKRTLIFAILKFLKSELKQEGISADFKESLEGEVKIYLNVNSSYSTVSFKFNSGFTVLGVFVRDLHRGRALQE